MEFALNELSIHQDMCSITNDKARELITEFVELLHSLVDGKSLDCIISTDEVYSFYITRTYGIREWLNDSLVKKSYQQYFRVMTKRCSFIYKNDYGTSEFIVSIDGNNFSSIGCLVAHEMQINTVSIKTHDIWGKEIITGAYSRLNEDTGELTSIKAQISNVSDKKHMELIQETKKEAAFIGISSGQDLWENKDELFPNLIFCQSVKDQLYSNPEKFHIVQVMKKLRVINEYFNTYKGIYNPNDVGVYARTESESVKTDPNLKAMRLFQKPDGIWDYFYDHVGFTGKYCGRIHFLADDINRKCYIGYIGKHLKTGKF